MAKPNNNAEGTELRKDEKKKKKKRKGMRKTKRKKEIEGKKKNYLCKL